MIDIDNRNKRKRERRTVTSSGSALSRMLSKSYCNKPKKKKGDRTTNVISERYIGQKQKSKLVGSVPQRRSHRRATIRDDQVLMRTKRMSISSGFVVVSSASASKVDVPSVSRRSGGASRNSAIGDSSWRARAQFTKPDNTDKPSGKSTENVK